MLGSPMPTKQAVPSRSALAAATLIISSAVQSPPAVAGVVACCLVTWPPRPS